MIWFDEPNHRNDVDNDDVVLVVVVNAAIATVADVGQCLAVFNIKRHFVLLFIVNFSICQT